MYIANAVYSRTTDQCDSLTAKKAQLVNRVMCKPTLSFIIDGQIIIRWEFKSRQDALDTIEILREYQHVHSWCSEIFEGD